jgi:hypothetical protein
VSQAAAYRTVRSTSASTRSSCRQILDRAETARDLGRAHGIYADPRFVNDPWYGGQLGRCSASVCAISPRPCRATTFAYVTTVDLNLAKVRALRLPASGSSRSARGPTRPGRSLPGTRFVGATALAVGLDCAEDLLAGVPGSAQGLDPHQPILGRVGIEAPRRQLDIVNDRP